MPAAPPHTHQVGVGDHHGEPPLRTLPHQLPHCIQRRINSGGSVRLAEGLSAVGEDEVGFPGIRCDLQSRDNAVLPCFTNEDVLSPEYGKQSTVLHIFRTPAFLTCSPSPSREMFPRVLHVKWMQRWPRDCHHAVGRRSRCRCAMSPLVTAPENQPASNPSFCNFLIVPEERRELLETMKTFRPAAARRCTAATVAGLYVCLPSCNTPNWSSSTAS